jgi:valyl-tRNA synthetase
MVLDGKGQKMSKSKGNVVDVMKPIGEFGSDALRIGVVSARSPAQNQALLPDRVVTGRNFANKLWNIARYIEGKIGDSEAKPTLSVKSLADHWIVSELTQAQAAIEKNIKNYRFAEATDTVYHFIWNSVADWYIEANKTEENLELLAWVLQASLTLAHPFAPFVTETIWQTLKWDDSLLINAPWPEKVKSYNDIAAVEFKQLQALVSEIRFATKELHDKKQVLLYGSDSLIADNETLIGRLAGLKEVRHTDNPKGLRLAVPGREAWLEINEKSLKKHHKELEARIGKVSAMIKTFEARLANDSYVKNAPPRVVEETRQALKEQKQLEARLKAELELV